MKIDPKHIQNTGKPIGESGTAPKKTTQDGQQQFDSLLNQALSAKGGTVKPPAGAPPLHPASPVQALNRTAIKQRESVQKLETLFITMDMFKNALGNTEIEMPRVQGILREMVSKSEEAVETMSRLPEGDPLRRIISDTAVAVLTESQRFDNQYASL